MSTVQQVRGDRVGNVSVLDVPVHEEYEGDMRRLQMFLISLTVAAFTPLWVFITREKR